GGKTTSGDGRGGGGGRIAIKYGNVEDMEYLLNQIDVSGPGSAGEGTLYLKNMVSGDDLLYIKGDGTSSRYTGVGKGYTSYLFDKIEVNSGSQLYKIGTEIVYGNECIKGGSPVGIIDTNIHCGEESGFIYYDLSVKIRNFELGDRKYLYEIDGPVGGGEFMQSSTGTINGDSYLTMKVKFLKRGSYHIKFNLYDGNDDVSLIDRTVLKNISITN
ncbi:MAG: hypothetical protein PHN31_06120, partial [Candidatus Gracilibacteria bacterium]|nr:hypothetical protein [Candidatus Gracilibacteria bacterium]